MIAIKTGKIGAALIVGLLLASAPAQAQKYEPSDEQWMVRAVNAERAKQGLSALQFDDRLTEIARKHSVRMSEAGELSHQFSGEPAVRNRVASTGMRFNYSGENVAFDSKVETAHSGLMLSPPHHENIMNPDYNVIGIGIVRKGTRLYVTQDFARRLPEMSINEAEDSIAKSFAGIRRVAGTQPLPRIARPELRTSACDMAKADSLTAQLVPRFKNMQNIVVWTATELEQLPPNLMKLKSSRASGYSLGACLAPSATYPNAVYWIVLVTYY
jgi:Cysteine-rich secretory protein family